LKWAPDHEGMDLLAIAIAVVVFGVLALTIEGLERV
jgi:hypothetical protein